MSGSSPDTIVRAPAAIIIWLKSVNPALDVAWFTVYSMSVYVLVGASQPPYWMLLGL